MKKSNAFSTLEIILSVALIAIFATAFIKLFATADQLNDQAQTLDRSVILATGIMERLKISEDIKDLGTYDDLNDAHFESAAGIQTMKIAYDSNWDSLAHGSKDVAFELVLNETVDESAFITYKLIVYHEESIIYELELIK